MRVTLHAIHPTGYPIDIELDANEYERLDQIVQRLLDRGYRAPAQAWPLSPEGLPICPKHQAVMAQREKQGDSWYSHRVITAHGEELYCRGLAYGPTDKDGFQH